MQVAYKAFGILRRRILRRIRKYLAKKIKKKAPAIDMAFPITVKLEMNLSRLIRLKESVFFVNPFACLSHEKSRTMRSEMPAPRRHLGGSHREADRLVRHLPHSYSASLHLPGSYSGSGLCAGNEVDFLDQPAILGPEIAGLYTGGGKISDKERIGKKLHERGFLIECYQYATRCRRTRGHDSWKKDEKRDTQTQKKGKSYPSIKKKELSLGLFHIMYPRWW